jgi:hypothetical protein
MAARISRCEKFFAGTPLGHFPDDHQHSRYWLDQALEGRDALALIERALRESAADASSDEQLQLERRTSVSNDLREAVRTGEPAVLFKIGALLSNPSVAKDASLQSPAWFFAACSAGYDCSAANPDVGFGCPETGTCNAGFTIPDRLQEGMPPKLFAQAYAAGQDILSRIALGDWEGLEPHLELGL